MERLSIPATFYRLSRSRTPCKRISVLGFLALALVMMSITTPVERKTCGKQFCLGGVCTSIERKREERGAQAKYRVPR